MSITINQKLIKNLKKLEIMNTNLKTLGLLFIASISLLSCTPNEEVVVTSTIAENVEPVNGKSFSANEAKQPITFKWTPLGPKPQEPVTYRLRVWQLMQGQNSTEAMRTNQPIVTKDVTDITEASVQGIYTGPCRPPYLCDYVWSVKVLDNIGTTNSKEEITSVSSVFSF